MPLRRAAPTTRVRRAAARLQAAGQGAENVQVGETRNHNSLLAPLTVGATMTDEQKRLSTRIRQVGGLRRLAVAISENAGYLSQVASGRRRACNRLRLKLGLQPRRVLTDACRKCGDAHTSRRCTRRPTFDELAARYDAWAAKHRAKHEEWVRWAELRALPK